MSEEGRQEAVLIRKFPNDMTPLGFVAPAPLCEDLDFFLPSECESTCFESDRSNCGPDCPEGLVFCLNAVEVLLLLLAREEELLLALPELPTPYLLILTPCFCCILFTWLALKYLRSSGNFFSSESA